MCVVCNVKLQQRPHEGNIRFADRKLCSLRCRQIYITKLRHKNWKSKLCIFCNKEISRHISKLIYCNDKCMRLHRVGSNSPAWKGGRKNFQGYIQIYSKNHPLCPKGGYMFEHRLIFENWLRVNDPKSEFLMELNGDKYLNPKIIIHHKNNNKIDNRIENLVPVKSQRDHFHFTYCPQCSHCKSGEFRENPERTILIRAKGQNP